MQPKSDATVLRSAITQLLIADLTTSHGWREGISYHSGPPAMRPDLVSGESLVKRGIMQRLGSQGLMRLSAASVERALRVAVTAAISDLLVNDPPPASFEAELDEDEDEDASYLVLVGLDNDEAGVRSW